MGRHDFMVIRRSSRSRERENITQQAEGVIDGNARRTFQVGALAEVNFRRKRRTQS